MKFCAEDFYLSLSNNKFKKFSQVIQDGHSGIFFVLKILDDTQKEMTAGDIADIFGVTTARTAVILNTLEKKGYLSKSKSSIDARKTIVSITESGHIALEQRKVVIFEMINTMLSKLTDEEISTLFNILQKLFQ